MSRSPIYACVAAVILLVACGTEQAVPAVPVAARPVVSPELRRAFALLDSALSPADRDTIRATPAAALIRYHFGLGMGLRNDLGLWSNSAARAPWERRGLRHPDDMSQVIIEAYWLYLHDAPIPLDSLVRATPPAPTGFKALPATSTR